MTDLALHAVTRNDSPNFGVCALIVLALLSVMVCITHPEAITAEYQTLSSVSP